MKPPEQHKRNEMDKIEYFKLDEIEAMDLELDWIEELDLEWLDAILKEFHDSIEAMEIMPDYNELELDLRSV